MPSMCEFYPTSEPFLRGCLLRKPHNILGFDRPTHNDPFSANNEILRILPILGETIPLNQRQEGHTQQTGLTTRDVKSQYIYPTNTCEKNALFPDGSPGEVL